MTTVAVALGLAAGYFAFELSRLERRVDALSAQLGAPAATDEKPPGSDGQGSDAKRAAAAVTGHEQRIAQLERDMVSVRADVHSLEEATANTLAVPPTDPKEVLSIVNKESNRVRARQLDFQRGYWLKWRTATLNQFAAANHLRQDQTDQLNDLLTSEADRLVDIMREPDLADNPEQMVADVATALRDTDYAARGILDKEQYGPWQQARAFERRVLWPWLPPE